MDYAYNRITERLKNTTINTYSLAKPLFALPCKSVPVERVFSTMKDITSVKRNKLTVENV